MWNGVHAIMFTRIKFILTSEFCTLVYAMHFSLGHEIVQAAINSFLVFMFLEGKKTHC